MLLSLVFGYSKLVGAFVVSGHKSAYGAHRYQLSISNVKGARRLPVWGKKVMEAGREVESRQSPYESDLRPPLPA